MDPPSIPRKGTEPGAFLRRVLTICTSVINRYAPIVGIILAGVGIIWVGGITLWFAISLIAFMGDLLPIWLLSGPPIFGNDFVWLGALALIGIGLGIAGEGNTAGKIFPVLTSIWFVIAALSMCAWSIFLAGPPKALADIEVFVDQLDANTKMVRLSLLYAVYGFLFGLVGLVFAAVCRWVLERKPQSIGVRVFSYTSLFLYLVLTAAYAWFASHPFLPFSVLGNSWATWQVSMDRLVDAFILCGIVFCIGASITFLRRYRAPY